MRASARSRTLVLNFGVGDASAGLCLNHSVPREFVCERVGSALVKRAEQWARECACHTMRLELLTPRHWIHPSKEFLRQWYSRTGYTPQTPEPFEAMHPEQVPELATECDFTVWHKPLPGIAWAPPTT